MQEVNQQEFFTKLDRFSGFALINLLWVIGSAFIITLPLATVGMFAVLADWVRGKDSEAIRHFFGGVRQYGVKASIIGLLDAVLLGVIVINLHLIPQMGLPIPMHYPYIGVMLFGGMLLMMVNLYIWMLLVIYDLSLKSLINIALKLSIIHIGQTTRLLLLTIAILMLGLVLPALISVLILFSSCVYVVAWGAWRVIQPYDADLRQIYAQERAFSS